MNTQLLQQMANTFAEMFANSPDFRSHMEDHQRRSRRALEYLTLDKIPQLGEEQIKEMFFDSDGFAFWSNKEWEFANRVENVGLEGFRSGLYELINRAEHGLTPNDLGEIWAKRGLGRLLSTELLTYRFPDQYWTFNDSVTISALSSLDEDIRKKMPRGQKADQYTYFALEPHMNTVVKALRDAGLHQTDYLLADIFMWWFKENVQAGNVVSTLMLSQILERGERSQKTRKVSDLFLNQVAVLLQDRTGTLNADIGVRVRNDARKHQFIDRAFFYLSPTPGAGETRFSLALAVYLIPGELWWGLFDWGSNEYIQRLSAALSGQSIWSPDEQLLTGKGAFHAEDAFPGGMYLSIGHSLPPGDVAAATNVDSLALRIADDLANLYDRLQPQLSSIQHAIQGVVSPARKFWLFQANPEYYHLAEEVKRITIGDEDGWAVTAHLGEMHAGEPVLLWQSGSQAGIYAIGELLGEPIERPPIQDPDVLREKPYLASRWWVRFRYTQILDNPILRKTLLAHPILQKMRIIRSAQGSNFAVTAEEWEAVQQMILESGITKTEVPDLLGTLQQWFRSQGLCFSDLQIATFFTALQTKGFVILSGISGTGKTRLAQYFADPLQRPEGVIWGEKKKHDPNWQFISVRPDWRDGKSLLGYYNPITQVYEWTPFLRFLMRAVESYQLGDGQAWFVILDEMNLARVEYYFADLLSVLESGRDRQSWTREPLSFNYPDGLSNDHGSLPPHELYLPPNLYIVGTVNVDETTHAFSPKVLDRAFTIELAGADFDHYPPEQGILPVNLPADTRRAVLDIFTHSGRFAQVQKERMFDILDQHPEYKNHLVELCQILEPYEFHFGYRTFDEIMAFLDAGKGNRLFEALGGLDTAFDYAVLMKVLPKFHGSRGRLEQPLRQVLAWCIDPSSPVLAVVEEKIGQSADPDRMRADLQGINYRYRATAARTIRMLWSLYTTGFASFG